MKEPMMARTISFRGAIQDETQCKSAQDAVEEYVTNRIKDALEPATPFLVGRNYLVRTITMIDVGKVKAVIGNFLVMEDASWIGDTGRFYECLTKTDVFNEIEPFKFDVYINLNSIVDATLWPFELPKAPK